MRIRTVVTTIAATVLATPFTLAVGGPASAATPPQVVHTQVNVSLTGIDVCGFTVDSVIRGTATVEVWFDASGNVRVQNEAHVVSTLTNEANGKVVHVEGTGRDSQPFGVVNPDGTITFTDTLTGIDNRVYTSHSNVLVKDAGFLSIVDTVDSQGNLLNEQVIEHGPHQFAGDFTAECDAIASAIG
jgi:streptogramin lyase